ncbi:MAG: hypothetical protein D6714_13675 [Bacteroidetes bacterium]|nr:MAG: hypothetical protein D6714_13675 [Bacteroidota bacterium]
MKSFLLKYSGIVVGLPLLFWLSGGYTRNAAYKEILSVCTILSFCIFIGQFYLTRFFRKALFDVRMSRLVKAHEWLGYAALGVIGLHPLFVILPKFIEPGLSPGESLLTIFLRFDNWGVVSGIFSWLLLIGLGAWAFFRQKISLSYRSWRMFHGMMSVVFIATALLHVVLLGRHITALFAASLAYATTFGVLHLLAEYAAETPKNVSAQIGANGHKVSTRAPELSVKETIKP